MNKNIIIVYGFSEYRRNYLYHIQNANPNDIYITMDNILFSSGILARGENNIMQFKQFFENNGQSEYLVNTKKDTYVNYFYESVKNNNFFDPKLCENMTKKIDTNTINYLFRSLSYFLRYDFLKGNYSELSISTTLNRRKGNVTKKGDYKEYKNYQAGFLAKNNLKRPNPFSANTKKDVVNPILGHDNYPNRSSGRFISNSSYGHYNIGNRKYTSDIFDAFLKSDKEGFQKASDFQSEQCQNTETRMHKNLIANCFSKAFIRKLCKLSIEWAELEASKAGSPIKKIIFYVEEHPLLNIAKVDNINVRNLHHKWRHSDFKDIGSNNRNFPITYSELKYATELTKRKTDHHIEFVQVENRFADAKKIIDNL
ncbi:hypothetical protein ID858_01510 [Xenorhabdus sp. DI]|uniref:hypothetical protein n=1 Tax=Xenorhabdus doucetiae TaxID=351671 RepID=UPI0019854D0A|nr:MULTISPECIES: hypothetical protein [unclassified Xenorhabdus]MBD2784344.1 hypothetical protein [Xenorhabdus sp. 3]MBD2787191.1 hypothetical protein [Xenorhabdus sp. DI]